MITDHDFNERSAELLYRHDIPAALHAALVDFSIDQAHPSLGRALALLEDLCWRLERPLFDYFKEACAEAEAAARDRDAAALGLLSTYYRAGGGDAND